MALNNRQRVFISEYLKDFNATRAAKAAGYSEKTAYSIGQRLLKDVEIKQAIDAEIDARTMGKSEILTRLTDFGRGDMAELMDIHSTGYNLKLMIKDDDGNLIVNPKTKLIRKIKQKVTTHIGKKDDDDDVEVIETDFELYSALEATEFMAKLRGLITEKVDVTTKGEKVANADDRNDRALSTLADALREILLEKSSGQDSALDPPK
jgi:phage terminase small subunit